MSTDASTSEGTGTIPCLAAAIEIMLRAALHTSCAQFEPDAHDEYKRYMAVDYRAVTSRIDYQKLDFCSIS